MSGDVIARFFPCANAKRGVHSKEAMAWGLSLHNSLPVLLCALVAMGLSVSVYSQSIPPEQTRRPSQWDSNHRVAFFGTGVLFPKSLPIRSYSGNTQRSPDINVFKDFPNAQKATVISASAAPQGETVLSVVLDDGQNVLHHVILRYDSSGGLDSVWDTEPYFAWGAAADSGGNVFALETQLGVDSGKPYPMLVKYDHSGAVVGQFLYSNNFKHSSDAVNPGFGKDLSYAALELHNDELFIYAPVEKEVIVCTTSGTVVRRESLDEVRDKIAKSEKVKFTGLRRVAFVDDSHVMLDLAEYPSDTVVDAPPKPFLVNLDTHDYHRIDVPTNARFLGVQDGSAVMLRATHDQKVVVESQPLPKP